MKETRAFHIVGDFLIGGVVVYSLFRAYKLSVSNAYQHHLSHLNNYPPAIVANEFDFVNLENNRKLSRSTLQEYRDSAVKCKIHNQPLETIIFHY